LIYQFNHFSVFGVSILVEEWFRTGVRRNDQRRRATQS
jgi:hypothetical protein